MSMRMENKVLIALEQYFDTVSSDPINLAARVANLPDPVQERIWEFTINYIMETAGRGAFHSGLMSVYGEQARDIRKHL